MSEFQKFQVGDYVVFHPERVTKLTPDTDWQFNVPTTPLKVVEYDDLYHLEGSIFSFCESWLEPAEKQFGIKSVKFNGPATIVFWTDGTKTVVKCSKKDHFDPEKGIALACAKKLLGDECYHTIRDMADGWNYGYDFSDMGTEEIRDAVLEGCMKYPAFGPCELDCPCNREHGRCCTTICVASRDQLIPMLKAFRDNGDWRRR